MHHSAEVDKEVLKNLETEKGLEEVEYKNDPEKLAKYIRGYNYNSKKIMKITGLVMKIINLNLIKLKRY